MECKQFGVCITGDDFFETSNLPQSLSMRKKIILQSILDYPDLLELDKIAQIIENMNINEEQKLIKFRKQHLIMKQNI